MPSIDWFTGSALHASLGWAVGYCNGIYYDEEAIREFYAKWTPSPSLCSASDNIGVNDVAGMRHFGSGAARDQDTTKPDYHGFTSPLVKKRFGQYMNKHRVQPDGSIRSSSNWKLGIPLDAYIKSADRHMEDWKLHHDGFGDEAVEELEDSLCALIFNAQGYLFEILKEKRQARQVAVSAALHENAKALGASLLGAPGQLE